MKKLLGAIFLTTLFPSITSCDRLFPEQEKEAQEQTIEVNGKISLTPADPTNLDYEEVYIYAVPRHTFLDKLRWLETDWQTTKAILSRMESDTEAAQTYFEAINALAKSTLSLQEDKAIRVLGILQNAGKLRGPTVAELTRVTELLNLETYSPSWDAIIQTMYTESIEQLAIEKTSCDIRGNFSMKMHSDTPVFIVAKVSKTQSDGEAEEHIFWVQEVSNSDNNIALTSDNSLTTPVLKQLITQSNFSENDVIERVEAQYKITPLIENMRAQTVQLNELNEYVKEYTADAQAIIEKYKEHEILDQQVQELTQKAKELEMQAH